MKNKPSHGAVLAWLLGLGSMAILIEKKTRHLTCALPLFLALPLEFCFRFFRFKKNITNQ